MTKATSAPPVAYRERLWPSVGLILTLLLLLPAVAMVITPINADLAIPAAIAVYLVIAGTLLATSPVVSVSEGVLQAGSANIPVQALGKVKILDREALRGTLGPGADARAYLVVRGVIHRGLRIEVSDPSDPTPYWVITTRTPEKLAAAIEASR